MEGPSFSRVWTSKSGDVAEIHQQTASVAGEIK